ncbi:hypothetical protein IH980_01535 [Patescibacteria group bacterium]|nr:hypothetical protein [Patescibacteria group bacterium]
MVTLLITGFTGLLTFIAFSLAFPMAESMPTLLAAPYLIGVLALNMWLPVYATRGKPIRVHWAIALVLIITAWLFLFPEFFMGAGSSSVLQIGFERMLGPIVTGEVAP